jgi:DNA repair protein RadA/Sms
MPLARARTKFVCQHCGGEQPKWLGRCPDCGEWNTLIETVEPVLGSDDGARESAVRVLAPPQRLDSIAAEELGRIQVPLEEFNRVLGGGLVPGSVVLIGGDPGIGKSTLLLQVSALLAVQHGPVLYVSGEESARQIKLRAQRLGVRAFTEQVYVLAETNVAAVVEHIKQLAPRLVVVDSIQTMYAEELTSAPGSVSQLRECTLRLLQLAKTSGVIVFLVGHVTKDGTLAGPRVLEHMVDAVLYLEGERFHTYRLLRAVKNRFGSTNEVGMFEMQAEGLVEVANPSHLFLSERVAAVPGSTVIVSVEGSRALLLEVQALVTTTHFGLPRRAANGLDLNRLHMLVAVLSKRLGLALGNQDIYVNAVGGLKIGEPAADLGVAVAIASGYQNAPVDPEAVLIGEVGLAGELRSVPYVEKRLAEAARLGFRRCLVPAARDTGAQERRDPATGMAIIGVRSVGEALEVALTR